MEGEADVPEPSLAGSDQPRSAWVTELLCGDWDDCQLIPVARSTGQHCCGVQPRASSGVPYMSPGPGSRSSSICVAKETQLVSLASTCPSGLN